MAVVLKTARRLRVRQNNQYGEGIGFARTIAAAATSPAAPRGFERLRSRSSHRRTTSSPCTRWFPRGGRARPQRRRAERNRGRHLPLLRPSLADAQLYRGKDEVKNLRRNRDCLKHFRARVGEAALIEADALDTVDREVEDLITHAITAARAADPPDDTQLLTDVYVSY